ncbi:alpha-2,8-sialyltransferase 8F-like [Empidonax traillii]|uniref:alpha-2,8-sialyltransferase 8F-like n=1 Tax=Empidonax traillii TaxID=164674 RepID=UPI000FFD676D|nr:alpha-2,8-sialyltransferase 8F-like [Empidonax traillii]
MTNIIIGEVYVKPGLLKMHKLWVLLLAVAAVSFASMGFLVLKNIPDVDVAEIEACQGLLSNITQPQKAELGHCCNASTWLAVTQENAPLDSSLVYDMSSSKGLKVSSGFREILPKKSPFLDGPYKTCAVVGNGGILRNSSCGSKIDEHEFVIRFNLPSMDFPDDVGRKTNVVTVNPSILNTRFHGLVGRRLPFVKAASSYGKTWFLIPAFSFPGLSEVSYRAFYALEDSGSESHVIFFHPQYLSALSKYWRDHGFHVYRLSSGFMLVNAALELCQHITLYGFWPFSLHPDGYSLTHHYYDNMLPKKHMHSMPKEFAYYVDMHFHGVLQVHVGQC